MTIKRTDNDHRVKHSYNESIVVVATTRARRASSLVSYLKFWGSPWPSSPSHRLIRSSRATPLVFKYIGHREQSMVPTSGSATAATASCCCCCRCCICNKIPALQQNGRRVDVQNTFGRRERCRREQRRGLHRADVCRGRFCPDLQGVPDDDRLRPLSKMLSALDRGPS